MSTVRTTLFYCNGINNEVVDDFVSDEKTSEKAVKHWMDYEGRGDNGRNSTAPRKIYNSGSDEDPSIREQYRYFERRTISDAEIKKLGFQLSQPPYDKVMRRRQ